ncbi:hypothetical protein K435DRAFT_107502 [Dendrothele bispora CBS 962.96]|uniref:Uncharacterized protein n=1 Tax=Dendrothele bispora (strain CBS 962.96) TaxID=1314807 RepID=A0A4S8MQZ8_DENBC|nr:hypothetical protein K435DRAFT_107502 [Dendrothele bispora CBS 962.96]
MSLLAARDSLAWSLPLSISQQRLGRERKTVSFCCHDSITELVLHTLCLARSPQSYSPRVEKLLTLYGTIRASTNHQSVNVGAIVGGTVGGVALLAILVLAYVFYRRRRMNDIEEGPDSPRFRPSLMVRVRSSFRFSRQPASRDTSAPDLNNGSEKKSTSWLKRFGLFLPSQPGSPSEDSLVGDRRSPSSVVTSEKAPLPHRRIVELQRQTSPLDSAAPMNRPIPPIPLHSVDMTDRKFVLAFPENKGGVRGPRDSLISYDTSNRSNRRRVQIPPQAVIIGGAHSLASKRRSRSLTGPRNMSSSGRTRRSLLSSIRPLPQQRVPSSSVPTPTETEFQPGRQAVRHDALNRLLGRDDSL